MIKKTMLAAVVAAFAFAALPALAAADPSIDLPGGNGHFSVEGGEGHLVGAANVTCTSNTGEGEFENSETGTIELTFHGCTGPFGVNCTTSGQSTGTITTTKLTFHLVTVNHNGTTAPGVLITSNSGHFATFDCTSFFHIVVGGNGIIGTITKPGYNEPSATATVKFQPTKKGANTQTHTKIVGSETEYKLTASLNGGAAEPASEEAEGIMTFAGGKATLTEK